MLFLHVCRSQVYTARTSLISESHIVKVKVWLESAGVKLNTPTSKILQLKEEQDGLFVWQLEPFDELILLDIPICEMRDEEIELVIELNTISGDKKCLGSMKVFAEAGTLKSGLFTIFIGDEIKELVQLEDCLYRRKSKQVPNWHIQLMKERLKELKGELKGDDVVINVIIPIPSYPLKLKNIKDHEYGGEVEDVCMRDVKESQEDSIIKRKYPKLFNEKIISNGDLRVLRRIVHGGFIGEEVPVDVGNILWTHREFLSRKYPIGLISFVKSVQWWLNSSDPTEIDEALRIISKWKLPKDSNERLEICSILIVTISEINGIFDSNVWLELFANLIEGSQQEFTKKYQSAIILFLRSGTKMEGLKEFFKRKVLFGEDEIDRVSELYWRLKVEAEGMRVEGGEIEGEAQTGHIETDETGSRLFKEYKDHLSEEFIAEIRKQERLFKCIEEVLILAQKMKGSRTMKLDHIKKGLSDPESGVPSAAQQFPMIPGLQDGGKRISAIVPERSNLFKSTAFTVLLVFLRQSVSLDQKLSLPLIFKRGDDLRRDSACLRVFRVIWDIWREEGGLELFPKKLLYGVTPLSKEFGIVEFIESVPLSRIILSENSADPGEWAISEYLKELPDPAAVSNFLPSCVGFSLLTYLLGIGDRHLDNLLLTPSGQLLHIDFSFVFGSDPKPFPPPIKITREMVRGFGCDDSEGDDGKWNEFKGLCFTALTLLRQKSPLILAVLRSEYPSDPVSLVFVKDRLSMMTSQAESLTRLDRLMEESRRAMFPVVMETIHKWVQYWRS